MAWLLITFFMMLHHFKLLDEIEFDVSRFCAIMNSIFMIEIQKDDNNLFLPRISKIWSGILNGSRNTMQIDDFDKLVLFSSIFAFDLSRKLERAVTYLDVFTMTKNKTQRFSIIYLTLIAFPIIGQSALLFSRLLFMKLNRLVEIYIQRSSIAGHCFESKLLLTQFFTKSQVSMGFTSPIQTTKCYMMSSKLFPIHSHSVKFIN
ncbi:hypothetical protein RF11_08720 [Thelohanellus kitauei]|uniref:Uncharacterized protein n=1 Tax=Thelohanellus kitauei TaxID=669202 RepID=A0A0C2IEL9_THEKT|nr:hypothetical protein RF11_08720 [Thelohanellus kitauei]